MRSCETFRDIYVYLLSHVVKKNKEESLPAVRVLVQHLCMKVPDQSEFRNSVGKVLFTEVQHFATRNDVLTVLLSTIGFLK